ncbi:MAG TPA: class I SAM-dependent methyltransferase [Acidimicrobiales bacterium]|nr:class I SAM-dependent methyltransferase [Acidimicrobiales bacterium]
MINDTASSGFERGAADYEKARPSYPSAVLDALPSSGRIVDLAAGTGKLTRLLRGDVLAVEPVAAMRAIAATFAPTVAGTAEHLPLRDESVDAVTVAQAFHWFDAPRALAEIRRVLKPGGMLLLVWNDRDNRVPWVAEMTKVVHAHDPGAYQMVTDWYAVIAAAGGFTPVELAEVDNPQRDVNADTVVARATSTSYVAAAGDAVVEQVARDVRAIVDALDEPFDYPYVTQIFTCSKRS